MLQIAPRDAGRPVLELGMQGVRNQLANSGPLSRANQARRFSKAIGVCTSEQASFARRPFGFAFISINYYLIATNGTLPLFGIGQKGHQFQSKTSRATAPFRTSLSDGEPPTREAPGHETAAD